MPCLILARPTGFMVWKHDVILIRKTGSTQRTTKPSQEDRDTPRANCTKYWSSTARFLSCASGQRDKQTNTHTHHNTSQPYVWGRSNKVIMNTSITCYTANGAKQQARTFPKLSPISLSFRDLTRDKQIDDRRQTRRPLQYASLIIPCMQINKLYTQTLDA